MRKLLFIVSAGVIAGGCALYGFAKDNDPALRNGDLIFQTSSSNQSAAIFAATGSLFTHMGIIKNDNGRIVVIEAVSEVKETPLNAWAQRGILGRFAVYRRQKLTSEQTKKIISSARQLYGRLYDIFFSFTNDSIYCSELPFLAYKAAGLSIGKVQKISHLNVGNQLTRELIKGRWQRHADCRARKYDFDACYRHILDQDLVTPISIADDPNFESIYSNYPL